MKSLFFAIYVNKHALRHCGLAPQSTHNYGIAGHVCCAKCKQARNDDVVFNATKILFGVDSYL